MIITGKLERLLPLVTYGQQGKKKGGFVLKTDEADRSKTIYFTAFEKTYSAITAGEGDTITVDFTVESREYNGKYYTDCIAWSVTSQDSPKKENKADDSFRVPDTANSDFNDSLPF